ncbi:hypothetical protein FRC08_001012 [Ceratobasidium sp. 394]|nr:hypothetical protein FRC08_001012 [Ceratobasidium sp. 394]
MARLSTEEAKARHQAQRALRQEKADKINAALVKLVAKSHEMIEAAAEELDCEVEGLRRLFLANSTAHLHAKPTAWNGLVHEKSKEWADMKSEFSGGKYIQYVVDRIKNEGLYERMSEADEARYVKITQNLRDSKLSVGSSSTATQRKTLGNVFAELESMGQRLLHLHEVTGIEGMIIAVRGSDKDGMLPVYLSSARARTYLESHLKIDADHFVTLFECSAIGGAPAVANRHRTETQVVKSKVRVALLESLRTAATSIGSDGSEPTITNPLLISSISYSDYINTVRQYKVEVFNWPMDEDKMVDPSNVGGYNTLNTYLNWIEHGKAGFRRITNAEWEARKKARDEIDPVLPPKRSRKRANPSTEQQPNSKKPRKEHGKANSKSKEKAKSKRKRVANDAETASDAPAEASGSEVPAADTGPAGDHSNNDSGALAQPPPLLGLSLPPSTQTGANIDYFGAVPDSPPLDEHLTIVINRRPATPPTPSTVTDSAPPSSPNFLLHRVPTQAGHNQSAPNPSQGSPSRGRRAYPNGGDRLFINHTPDSMSSGRPPSRSTSPSSRSGSPARRTRPNKAHTPATASPLAALPTGMAFPSLTNGIPGTGNPFSYSPTPPPLGFGPPTHWFGQYNPEEQHTFSQGEWGFSDLHSPALGTPELGGRIPTPSEFAAPDA